MTNYPRAYLVDHPPARRQYRDRQARPTGCIVIHTAESQPDEISPDTGAENVARFLESRSTPGSYHDLADSDSDVHCVLYAKAAYGDGTGSNEWAIHLSLATQAHRWATLPKAWREAAVKNLARCAARANRWLVAHRHPACPPRRITRAQSEAGMAGFISHAERDPERRTDPGKGFPWALFLAEYARLTGHTTQEDDMFTDKDRELLTHVKKRLDGVTHDPPRFIMTDDGPRPEKILGEKDGAAIVRQIARLLDPEVFAAAVVAKMPAGGDVDVETVKAGVREVFAELATPDEEA